jgi:hypothetical protein
MTPFGRFKRRLAVLLSSAAADDYLAAIGRYGIQARKVSAAADVVMRSMNNVMLAVSLKAGGAASGLDLDTVVAVEVSRAAQAAASGIKAFEGLEDPCELYLEARRRKAGLAAKAALGRAIDAAGNLLLACERPQEGDLEAWVARYVEHSRNLLDARTAALQASLRGLRSGYPGLHFMQCLVSHSVMDRLAFDLFLQNHGEGEASPDDLRERFSREAGLALAAVDHGAAALSRLRRKLALSPRFGDASKPIRVLDELERSFAIERQIIPAYAAIVHAEASPKAVLEGLLQLQPLLEERTRLIDERHRILAS